MKEVWEGRLAHTRSSRLLTLAAGFLICRRVAGQLERQLNLTVMVALAPDHALDHQDQVIVMKVRFPA
jgi:hypothetical protein